MFHLFKYHAFKRDRFQFFAVNQSILQYTSALLLVFSAAATLNQFFGDPIQCDLPGGGVSGETLKNYCWMYSTFNIPDDFQGSCSRKGDLDKYGDEVFNSFYQWVSLCLVGQAILFFLPRALWLSLAPHSAHQDSKPSRCNSSSSVATWSDPVAWKWLCSNESGGLSAIAAAGRFLVVLTRK